MILVEGRIQVRDYTDNEGKKRYVTEIVAESVNFCGGKSTGTKQSTDSTYQQGSPSAPTGEFEEIDDDGELPF
jgi:single-strand DNA-binding protein